MGGEKRKAKSTKLNRNVSKLASYDKVLIVCEDSKAAPTYFGELVRHYKLNSANIKVIGKECGSAPISVFDYGKESFDLEKTSESGPYNRVYFVIDKDQHETYDSVINALNTTTYQDIFWPANSVPCFEYWLLLHFEYSTANYIPVGPKSSGDLMVQALKKYWPDYAKAKLGIFTHTVANISKAKQNAIRALKEAKATGAEGPVTKVHELVDYLQNLKKNSPIQS